MLCHSGLDSGGSRTDSQRTHGSSIKPAHLVILGKSRWCSQSPCSASVTNPDMLAKILSYFRFWQTQDLHGKCIALTMLLLHSPLLADITDQPQYSFLFLSSFSALHYKQTLPNEIKPNCHSRIRDSSPTLNTDRKVRKTWVEYQLCDLSKVTSSKSLLL